MSYSENGQVIRVPAMVPWPDSHKSPPNPHPHSPCKTLAKPQKIGDLIFGLGRPVAPDSFWICGTDLVWPVHEVNGMVIERFNGRFPYVCRHQFLAGD